MIDKEKVDRLLTNTETFGVERTTSTTDADKFCEAICAFANDMPNSRQPGYLMIGAYDDGRRSGLKATDELLKNLSSIRSDGNILPIPVMNVDTVSFDDGDVIVVEVEPSLFPPVRYRGRTWIRVGPRRSIATIEEEDRLVERRASNFPTYDCTPCRHATIDDIDVDLFKSAKNALIAALKDEKMSTASRYIDIFDIISNNPTVTYSALIDATGCSKRTIAIYVDHMKSIGVLARKGGSHGGYWEVKLPGSKVEHQFSPSTPLHG